MTGGQSSRGSAAAEEADSDQQQKAPPGRGFVSALRRLDRLLPLAPTDAESGEAETEQRECRGLGHGGACAAAAANATSPIAQAWNVLAGSPSCCGHCDISNRIKRALVAAKENTSAHTRRLAAHGRSGPGSTPARRSSRRPTTKTGPAGRCRHLFVPQRERVDRHDAAHVVSDRGGGAEFLREPFIEVRTRYIAEIRRMTGNPPLPAMYVLKFVMPLVKSAAWIRGW